MFYIFIFVLPTNVIQVSLQAISDRGSNTEPIENDILAHSYQQYANALVLENSFAA